MVKCRCRWLGDNWRFDTYSVATQYAEKIVIFKSSSEEMKFLTIEAAFQFPL